MYLVLFAGRALVRWISAGDAAADIRRGARHLAGSDPPLEHFPKLSIYNGLFTISR